MSGIRTQNQFVEDGNPALLLHHLLRIFLGVRKERWLTDGELGDSKAEVGDTKGGKGFAGFVKKKKKKKKKRKKGKERMRRNPSR